jgi:hypothetical protein
MQGVLNVGYWPEASFGCVGAIRPESGVKPTCRHRSNDAIDPKRTKPDQLADLCGPYLATAMSSPSGSERVFSRIQQ